MEENGVSMGGVMTTKGMQNLKLNTLAIFEWIGVL
jgi:hypothetical protein